MENLICIGTYINFLLKLFLKSLPAEHFRFIMINVKISSFSNSVINALQYKIGITIVLLEKDKIKDNEIDLKLVITTCLSL